MANGALNQLILQSLLKMNPQLGGMQFDSVGTGANQNLESRAQLNNAIAQSLGLPEVMSPPQKSETWSEMQRRTTQAAAGAGLPEITEFKESAPARARLTDAIARLESTGIQVPHFIGTPNEPTGDRGVTMDIENLVKGLKILENQALQVGDREALANISRERAFWEKEVAEGMSASEWKARGEAELTYPIR